MNSQHDPPPPYNIFLVQEARSSAANATQAEARPPPYNLFVAQESRSPNVTNISNARRPRQHQRRHVDGLADFGQKIGLILVQIGLI
jgi:hypothetical protein